MEPNELAHGLRDEFERRVYVSAFEHALRTGTVGAGFIDDAHDIGVRAINRYRYACERLVLADEIQAGEWR